MFLLLPTYICIHPPITLICYYCLALCSALETKQNQQNSSSNGIYIPEEEERKLILENFWCQGSVQGSRHRLLKTTQHTKVLTCMAYLFQVMINALEKNKAGQGDHHWQRKGHILYGVVREDLSTRVTLEQNPDGFWGGRPYNSTKRSPFRRIRKEEFW